MTDVILCIGGPPGSGKSTAGRLLAGRLAWEYRSAGELFRAEAARRGLDLEEFSHYAEAHPEIDRRIDEEMSAIARPGRVLDGRIQGPLLRREGHRIRSVALTAREEVRARRIAGRDGRELSEALRRIRERAESERARYRAEYGIDLDAEPADLTIDSSDRSAESVVDELYRFVTGAERRGLP